MIKNCTNKLILTKHDAESQGNCLSMVYNFMEQDNQFQQVQQNELALCNQCKYLPTKFEKPNIYNLDNYLQILDPSNSLKIQPNESVWRCPICTLQQKININKLVEYEDFNVRGRDEGDDPNQENTLIFLIDYSGSMNKNVEVTNKEVFDEEVKNSKIEKCGQSVIKKGGQENVNQILITKQVKQSIQIQQNIGFAQQNQMNNPHIIQSNQQQMLQQIKLMNIGNPGNNMFNQQQFQYNQMNFAQHQQPQPFSNQHQQPLQFQHQAHFQQIIGQQHLFNNNHNNYHQNLGQQQQQNQESQQIQNSKSDIEMGQDEPEIQQYMEQQFNEGMHQPYQMPSPPLQQQNQQQQPQLQQNVQDQMLNIMQNIDKPQVQEMINKMPAEQKKKFEEAIKQIKIQQNFNQLHLTKKDILLQVLDIALQEKLEILKKNQKKQRISFLLFNSYIYVINTQGEDNFSLYHQKSKKTDLTLEDLNFEFFLSNDNKLHEISYKNSQENIEALIEEGKKIFNTHVNHNIDQCYNQIIKLMNRVACNYETALGPALTLAIGMAKQEKIFGTQIIVVTDGMANKGLGKLEGQKQFKAQQYKDEANVVYEKLAQKAVEGSITIHIVAIKQEENQQVGLLQLQHLLKKTGGDLISIDPDFVSDFKENFAKLTQKKVAAVKTISRIYITLPRQIFCLKNPDNKGIVEKQFFYEHTLGNIFQQQDKEISIKIHIPQYKNIDVEDTVTIQVQTEYNQPDQNYGNQMFVSTKQFTFTKQFKEHIQNMQLDVLGVNLIQDLVDDNSVVNYSGYSKQFPGYLDRDQDMKSQYVENMKKYYQEQKMMDQANQCENINKKIVEMKTNKTQNNEDDVSITVDINCRQFNSKELHNTKQGQGSKKKSQK